MEVQLTAGGANLLMEYEEEEQEVWPLSPERQEEDEEDEDDDEDLEVFSLMEEEDPPVRIIPIPWTSSSPPPHHGSLECPGAPLGFRLNGRLVRPLPGGVAAELQLRSLPRGSASGFSSVQIRRPADPPIITGVVSAEAAQQVFSLPPAPPPPSDPPWTLVSAQTPSPASQTPPASLKSTPKSQSPPPSSRSTSPEPKKTRRQPLRPPHKGQLGPVPPLDCRVCMSQYKLITELRGFMCLCSLEIAQSLKSMKRKRKKMKGFRRKHKSKKSRRRKKSSKSRPPACKVSPLLTPPHRACGDFQFDGPPSPPSSCTPPPAPPPAPPPSDPPQGKLVIMAEDFYYGSAPGRRREETADRKFTGPLRCIHCPETLSNNTQLMSHMKDHVSPVSRVGGQRCSQCFRHLPSAFKLQQHMEAVHAPHLSTERCRICELAFGSEAAFLWHMKSTHRPGEMPYVCQVCGFRSSFYSDVWSHFQKLHSDSKHFLCQYCLRVMRSNNCYQQHFARHQKRNVFSCDKCRLHFLYIRERVEHTLNHRTHIRPPQLVGLRPGTRVTVRTYSVVADSERQERVKSSCRVVDVDPPPARQEAPKRNPVKSLGNLLASIGQQRRAASLQLLLSPLSLSVSLPPLLCVECLSTVEDFQTHFPSLVNCSLCRFITCCSTSYANHMINNHATGRKKPLYPVIFKADTRFSEALRCVSCTFTTCRGDLMANHLTERPAHTCIVHTHHGKSVNGSETQPILNPHSVTPSPGEVGGAFLLIPPRQPFPQLSLKHLPPPTV